MRLDGTDTYVRNDSIEVKIKIHQHFSLAKIFIWPWKWPTEKAILHCSQFPIVIVFGGMPIYQPSQAILGKKDTMMLHGANCIKDHRFFLK